MKKILLGSAAVVALSAATATAQEWSAKVGGYLTGGVALVDVGQEGNDFALIRDGEVHFNFRLAADNGLTFGSTVELEMGDNTSGAGNVIDEASGFVSGSFGRVVFGEQDGPADDFSGVGQVGADFTLASDGTGLLFDRYDGQGSAVNNTESGVVLDSAAIETSDSLKLSYYTPNFAGFTAGVAWVPQIGGENGSATSLTSNNEQNAIEIGAQYSGEFSGFGIVIGGGYATDTVNPTGGAPGVADDDYSWGVGARGSFAGFTLGTNYGYHDVNEVNTWSVGGFYKTGPWKVGADYAMVIETDDGSREDDMGIGAGVSYALAPGVLTGVTFEYASDGDDVVDDAYAGGLYMKLNF